MNEYTFLFKDNYHSDRDCVRYVRLDDIKKMNNLCCDGKIVVHGANYSMSLREDDANYEDITTILTKEEYETLCNPVDKDLTGIIEKLESRKNAELYERVIEEEKEYLMDEYNFDEEDIEQIFNEYYLDYRDRGIVSYVYDNKYDLGYEEAYGLGYVNRNTVVERYFDFEKFGNDLLEEEQYIKLNDGRCVCLNY